MPHEICPQDGHLLDWLAGRLPVEAAETLFTHLDNCPRCQAKLQTVSDVEDTLIDCLRQPWVGNEFHDEPQFREALARATAIGDKLPTRDQAGEMGEAKPDIVGELGEYRILEKLAEGGMGTVYKAHHTKLGREVALKVLPTGGLGSAQAIARFEREMQAVGRLDHPNIVRALDAREVEGTRFLVLEYVDGPDLSRLVRRRGPLPVAEACELVRQAAVGLQYAHEHGLIHRDVKPSNLIVDAEGQLKILDLGLARFRPAEPSGDETTRSGHLMGTVQYMAPEQASDVRSVDVRADIYGLGCTLHYLLAGRAPYAGETAYAILKAHHESPVPSLRAERDDVPEGLDRVFQKMVAKTPSERHASMTEVIADLDECLAKAGELERAVDSSEATSLGPQPKRSKRRVVAVLGVGAVTAMVLLFGLILTLKTPKGTLVLRVDQEGAQVAIDDGEITVTAPDDSEPMEIQLKVGEHTLTVSKGGFQARTKTVTIESRGQETVTVTLVPLPAGEATAKVEPPPPWAAVLPPGAPAPAVAPFDAAAAKGHQQAWARYLGLPVERGVDLPGGEEVTLVLIPPGEFLMGSSAEEQAHFLEKAKAAGHHWVYDRILSEDAHRVRITRPFYLGKYQVTQAQWEAVMGSNPSRFADDVSRPVEQVSWDDVQPFLAKLNESRNGQRLKFALPTEAQREYACRAGTSTWWHCGQSEAELQDYAWFNANSGGQTHPVGQLRPNAFGLYDMYGNVWEWCGDWYAADYYRKSPANDPSGPPTGFNRVNRGGGWGDHAWYCRSAYRGGCSPDGRNHDLGFRLAAVLVDEPNVEDVPATPGTGR